MSRIPFRTLTSCIVSRPFALPTPRPALIRTIRQSAKMSESARTFDNPIATLDASLHDRLPPYCRVLFEGKKRSNLTFEQIGEKLGRNEVAVAAIFYGQAKASSEDVEKLAEILELANRVDAKYLQEQMLGWPDRGRSIDMPPSEPLIYRLYEIVQNYGYAYKAVINERFGDGIMSAISFSTKVEKEEDDKGTWVKITMRGKWLPFTRF